MKLNNELLPHQLAGVAKMERLKVGALFMEQGTGKTITTIELARRRYEAGKLDSIIWLCPCSAKGNIKREIIKQAPKEMLGLFTICGIETLSTSIRALSYLHTLTENKRCFIVVDESLLVKNPGAYRTKHITQIASKCIYRIILNGTPVSRNEADLFSQFYILDWRILGYRSYWSFSANHLEYDKYNQLRNVLNVDALAEKIAPYTYQLLKKDCLNLPDKVYDTAYFDLSPEQEEEYFFASDVLLSQIDEWKSETIYRLFSGLQAVISGKKLIFNKTYSHFDTVELFENPMDNPRIKKLLNILPEKEKVIIFCRYESEITQLLSLLPSAVRFDGIVSMKKREQALKSFSEDIQFLVANKNCAGFSLNLQFCHKIIYMSNDWDLGTRLQSEDRVHRIGQEDTVQVTDLCADKTIDEKILSCLNGKEFLLDSLKQEIDKCSDIKEALKKNIYGSRYNREVFDCSELEKINHNI